ncbi:MAG TPA: GNAT family N-acetyltransferase [Ktedonobacterales bacterium]|nr:GNAT family N-acetyltransferase [Ktedonobacterales bacterium]
MDPDTCIVCGATATHRDVHTSATLCAQHARIEVVGPRPARRGASALPQLAIRDLTPDDQPAVRSISLAFRGQTAHMRPFAQTAGLLAQPGIGAFAASAGGEELAGLLLWTVYEGRGLIVDLSIWPRYQESGVATQLLALCEERLRSQRISQIIATTTNDNLPALAFYFAHGFAIERLLPYHAARQQADADEDNLGFAGVEVRDIIQLVKRL